MIISISIADGIQSGNFIKRWRSGKGTDWKEREFMEILAKSLHSATTFVRRRRSRRSRRIVGSENRWMQCRICGMRQSENSASSVNLAIKSHRSQLLWKSQWNYSRERQLLLHYQLPPSPGNRQQAPFHIYSPLAVQRSEQRGMEQGSPLLWQAARVHKGSATNKL